MWDIMKEIQMGGDIILASFCLWVWMSMLKNHFSFQFNSKTQPTVQSNLSNNLLFNIWCRSILHNNSFLLSPRCPKFSYIKKIYLRKTFPSKMQLWPKVIFNVHSENLTQNNASLEQVNSWILEQQLQSSIILYFLRWSICAKQKCFTLHFLRWK